MEYRVLFFLLAIVAMVLAVPVPIEGEDPSLEIEIKDRAAISKDITKDIMPKEVIAKDMSTIPKDMKPAVEKKPLTPQEFATLADKLTFSVFNKKPMA